MSEFGGHVTLTDDWARGVLNSMNRVKRKGTTGKMEPSPQFLVEETFSFQMAISKVAYEHVMIYHQNLSSTLTRLRYPISQLENIHLTLKVLITSQSKELTTNAKNSHICSKCGRRFLTDATNLHW